MTPQDPQTKTSTPQNAKDIADRLSQSELFQDVGPDALSQLAQVVEIRVWNPEEIILQKDDPGNEMFLLLWGKVNIILWDNKHNHQITITMVDGDVFGEMALLTNEPRSGDAIATEQSCALVFCRDTVFRLVKEYSQVAKFLTKLLGERLKNTSTIQWVGKYRLLGQLGTGGMATVYEGLHPKLDRSIAIKMLNHDLVHHGSFASRFQEEAKIMAKLRHPNIVEVYDWEAAYSTYFIIMEKIAGETLLDRMNRVRLNYSQVRRIIIQIAQALGAAHKAGIVHRDIKPSNVMIDDKDIVRLTDFGIAVIPDKKRKFSRIGTPRYMSPEIIEGQPFDGRSDIYSLGIIGYRLITGDVPFKGGMKEVLNQHVKRETPNPRTKAPDAPDDLINFVLKATEKSASQRFRKCEHIVAFLSPKGGKRVDQRGHVETITLVTSETSKEQVKNLVESVRQQVAKLEDVEMLHSSSDDSQTNIV